MLSKLIFTGCKNCDILDFKKNKKIVKKMAKTSSSRKNKSNERAPNVMCPGNLSNEGMYQAPDADFEVGSGDSKCHFSIQNEMNLKLAANFNSELWSSDRFALHELATK